MVTERVRSLTARSGHPNVEVDGVSYHSPYNPIQEAEKFYSAVRIAQADVVLHFGWGLGYCGPMLRRLAKPTARIIIFEPDEALFKLSLSTMDNRLVLEDPRFEIIVGPDVCQFFNGSTPIPCQETDRILWIEWPVAVRLASLQAELLKIQFQAYLRDRAANLLTHFQNGRTYFQNVIANFKFQTDADAGLLFDRFHGVPAFIVAAGPSLDRNVRFLREASNRSFILAVDTALRPLLAAGVTPHAVIMADPSELNARHVLGAMPKSTYLIAEQGVNPQALEEAPRRFLFGLGLFPDALFQKYGFAKSRLDVWGSVATAALDLVCRMGASPIIFVGQDFAYSWERDYASHTIYDGNAFVAANAGRTLATDIWGRSVHTTENLMAYRDFFIRRMRQQSGVRFINATEGGILEDGVEILSLEHALHQFCVQPVAASDMLASCYQCTKTSPAALQHLEIALSERRSSCSCFAGFLELTAKEYVLRGIDSRDARIEDCIQWGLKVVAKSLTDLSREIRT